MNNLIVKIDSKGKFWRLERRNDPSTNLISEKHRTAKEGFVAEGFKKNKYVRSLLCDTPEEALMSLYHRLCYKKKLRERFYDTGTLTKKRK